MYKEKSLRYSRKYNSRNRLQRSEKMSTSSSSSTTTASTIPPEINNIMLSRDNNNTNSIHIEEDIFDDVTPFMKQLGNDDMIDTYGLLSSFGNNNNTYYYDDDESIINRIYNCITLRNNNNYLSNLINKKVINNPSCFKYIVIIFLVFTIIIYVSVIIVVTSFNDHQTTKSLNKNSTIVGYDIDEIILAENSETTTIETENEEKEIIIPEMFENNLANVNSPYNENYLPMLWHIPRSGGTTVKISSFKCLDLVLAAEFGGMAPPQPQQQPQQDTNNTNATTPATSKESIQIVELETPKGRFINIDVSTVPGLQKAKELGLASSHKAQILVSRILFNMIDVLDETNKGRIFAFFRHPNDMIYSLYSTMTQEQKAAGSAAITSLYDYLESPQVPESWIVRQLSGNLRTKLKNDDLLIAKAIIKQKFLIGLLDETNKSFQRIMRYFHWEYNDGQWDCISNMWLGKSNENNGHDKSLEDYKNNETIMEKLNRLNEYDIALYEYAKELFVEQGEELFL